MDRNPKGSTLFWVLLIIVFMVAHETNGSLLAKIRKLVQDNGPNNTLLAKIRKLVQDNGPNNNTNNKTLQISPSPAPSPASDGLNISKCTSSLKTCLNNTQINITACLVSSSNELYLIVQNNGESSLKVNVTTAKTSSQTITIAKAEVKKVNVSEGRGSSIVLNPNNEACEIRFESPSTSNFFRSFPNYASAATPLNAVYLLLLGVLVFGGTWACCMLGKKERHVDGVPYKELEMGRPVPPSGGVDEETYEPWDEGWGDDWGEKE